MIQFRCTICGNDTKGLFPKLKDFTLYGARYTCTCGICSSRLLIQTFPFEIEPSSFLEQENLEEVCMN